MHIDREKFLNDKMNKLQTKCMNMIQEGERKSEFFASMSHELRTPLNTIIALSTLIQDDDDLKLHKSHAKNIQNTACELLSLVNNILDFSKMKVGKLDINIADIRVYDFKEKIILNFINLAHKKNLDFDIIIDEDTPKYLKTDRLRTSQIINNLISNAFKFTMKGKVIVNIFKLKKNILHKEFNLKKDCYIGFKVTDTGIGISKEACEIIFNAYSQADNKICDKYGGTGLGLYICKQLAYLLGGLLTCKSSNQGSEFTFYHPIHSTNDNYITRHNICII